KTLPDVDMTDQPTYVLLPSSHSLVVHTPYEPPKALITETITQEDDNVHSTMMDIDNDNDWLMSPAESLQLPHINQEENIFHTAVSPPKEPSLSSSPSLWQSIMNISPFRRILEWKQVRKP